MFVVRVCIGLADCALQMPQGSVQEAVIDARVSETKFALPSACLQIPLVNHFTQRRIEVGYFFADVDGANRAEPRVVEETKRFPQPPAKLAGFEEQRNGRVIAGL